MRFMRAEEFYAPRSTVVRHYRAGHYPRHATTGDLVLTRGGDSYARAIRFGERLHAQTGEEKFSWCNHAATVVSDEPGNVTVLEMAGRGGRLTKLADYARDEISFAVVHVKNVSPVQRDAAVRAAMWFLDAPYGWVSVASDAVYCLTGIPFFLTFGESVVCSAVACQSQRILGLIPDKPDIAVMPSDLARYFQVVGEEFD